MKRSYPLIISLFVIWICPSLHSSLSAQTLQYLDANNIDAGFGIGGDLFAKMDTAIGYDPTDSVNLFLMYEVPKDSGTAAIYAATIWMSGFDSAGNLHGAAQRYDQNGRDYYDGPIATVYNTAYDNYYKRVFKITQAQINQFRSLNFPVVYSSIDSAILLWPGIGNPYVSNNYSVNISSALAPFHDVDGDGIYDPAKGDYPAICGDEAIFFVFNDIRGPHSESSCTESFGIEVHGLAYVFIDSILPFNKSAIDNTVFVQYDIGNKSSTSYNNFYLGLWEDPDLGCFDNDRVGCDTNRNLMFAYNGTFPDPSCGIEKGYGNTFVSHGIKMLNQNMTGFTYFTNGASFSQADPIVCDEYRNYLTGFWNDSIPFTVGGTGYDTASGTPTKFVFPGDPNDTGQWSEMEPEVKLVLPPGDRRMLGSIGPMNFNSGETKHFDFAFTTSYDNDTTTNMIEIVDTLKRDADIVQQYYNEQILPCRNALIAMGINDLVPDELLISIFPNPSNTQITIETAKPLQWFEITDVAGRLIRHQNTSGTKNVFDVSSFAKGMYLLKLYSVGKFWVKKIVVD